MDHFVSVHGNLALSLCAYCDLLFDGGESLFQTVTYISLASRVDDKAFFLLA
jgi:hypothetical protein